MRISWPAIALLTLMAGLVAACGAGAKAPEPGSGAEEGIIIVDATQLEIMESYPVQVALLVRGALPTPCHELGWQVSAPDDKGRIEVRMFSTHDPAQVCIQVEQPFEERLMLGDFREGSYSVWLNGERVGEFDAP